MADTPTLDRMLEIKDASHLIGDFIEWFNGTADAATGRPRSLCFAVGEHGYAPLPQSTEALLAEYFDIDLAEAERERMAVLEEFSAAQAASS